MARERKRLGRPPRKAPPAPVDKSNPTRVTFSADDLGAAIQRVRQDQGMTQAELARRAGIHKMYVAKIEGGSSVPPIRTLKRISKALGVRLSLTFELEP